MHHMIIQNSCLRALARMTLKSSTRIVRNDSGEVPVSFRAQNFEKLESCMQTGLRDKTMERGTKLFGYSGTPLFGASVIKIM